MDVGAQSVDHTGALTFMLSGATASSSIPKENSAIHPVGKLAQTQGKTDTTVPGEIHHPHTWFKWP